MWTPSTGRFAHTMEYFLTQNDDSTAQETLNTMPLEGWRVKTHQVTIRDEAFSGQDWTRITHHVLWEREPPQQDR